MKNMLRVRYLLLTSFFGLFAVLQAHGQMKIGNHPTQIQPASILELESPNQALRLTQGDTSYVNNTIGTESGVGTNIHDTAIAAVKAAEGMIMYQNSDHSLYMRVGGFWRRVVSSANVDSTFWKLKGNTGTDSTTSFLGTLDQQALNIGADNKGYIIIHSNGVVNVLADSSFFDNNAGFGKSVTIADSLNVNSSAFKVSDSVYIGKPLAIHDSIVIKGLGEALSSDTAVLVLGSNGIVRKMSINAIGIRSVNSVKGPYLHLKFDSVAAGHTGPWIDSIQGLDSSYVILNIPDASPTVRGLMNTGKQTFAGAKSFRDSVAVGTTNKPNSTFQVSGNVSMADTTITANIDMNSGKGANFRTIICNVTGLSGQPAITVTLPSPVDGRIYTIKKRGDDPANNQIDAPVLIKTASAAEKIDGDDPSMTLYNNFTSVSLQAGGGQWYIVGH